MTADDDDRYAVILAGGRGTRLWPISTDDQPKQFQALGDSRPLIAQTFDRLAECVRGDHIFVSTTTEYERDVIAALPRLDPANLIVEPRPEGKPAAFLLVADRIERLNPQAVVLSAAADSFVSPLSAFQESCAQAFAFVEAHRHWTTILGSRPTRPDRSLGYIRASGAAMGVPGVLVRRDFQEKPTQEDAETFVAASDYYWNSSHYCFSVSTLLESYRQAAPEFSAGIRSYAASGHEADYDGARGPAHELQPMIDSGWSIGVVVSDFSWYDVGTWPSLYRALVDNQGGPFIAPAATIDYESDAGLVVNDSSMTVVTAGLEGIAVIVSESVVLVAPISKLEEQPETIAFLQNQYDAAHQADRETE